MGNKKCCWYTRKTRTFSKETHESNFILYSYCVTVGKSEVTRAPAESVNVCHSSGLIASIQLKSSHFPLSLPRWEYCDSRANTYCLCVDWLRKISFEKKIHPLSVYIRSHHTCSTYACLLNSVHVIQYEMPAGSACSHISTVCWQHNKGLQEFVIKVVKLWRICVW